ncbi:MAG: hypothetical protein A2W17_00605 [Planctomycetes bacterium RBG_16_41_13]|nr:MAG: hypothetical protein A2W17_00605 [Planctomycetes bacterium RBG_16_41_13]
MSPLNYSAEKTRNAMAKGTLQHVPIERNLPHSLPPFFKKGLVGSSCLSPFKKICVTTKNLTDRVKA